MAENMLFFPVTLLFLLWIFFLVQFVSGLGFGSWSCYFFFCYYYFPFELLSLLVIHLCKHCHYQPQCSQWLTLRYMHCSLQRANTSKCKGSDLSQLILYYGGKKKGYFCRVAAGS